MPAGRKALPAAVKKLRGNPGKRKIVPDTAAPMAGEHPEPKPGDVATLPVPPAPAHLTAEAQEAWNEYAPELVRSGLLRKLDAYSFEQFCEIRARWQRAMAVVIRKGETYKRKDGVIRPRPEARIVSECAKMLRGYAQEFGLTPAARVKVKHVTGDAPTPPNQPPLPGVEPPQPQPTPTEKGDPAPAGKPLEQVPDDDFLRGPHHHGPLN